MKESLPENVRLEPLLFGRVRACWIDAVVGGLGNSMFSPLSSVNDDDIEGFLESSSLEHVPADDAFFVNFNGEGTFVGLAALAASLLECENVYVDAGR